MTIDTYGTNKPNFIVVSNYSRIKEVDNCRLKSYDEKLNRDKYAIGLWRVKYKTSSVAA